MFQRVLCGAPCSACKIVGRERWNNTRVSKAGKIMANVPPKTEKHHSTYLGGPGKEGVPRAGGHPAHGL